MKFCILIKVWKTENIVLNWKCNKQICKIFTRSSPLLYPCYRNDKGFFYLADLQIAQKSDTRGTKNNFIKWNTYKTVENNENHDNI